MHHHFHGVDLLVSRLMHGMQFRHFCKENSVCASHEHLNISLDHASCMERCEKTAPNKHCTQSMRKIALRQFGKFWSLAPHEWVTKTILTNLDGHCSSDPSSCSSWPNITRTCSVTAVLAWWNNNWRDSSPDLVNDGVSSFNHKLHSRNENCSGLLKHPLTHRRSLSIFFISVFPLIFLIFFGLSYYKDLSSIKPSKLPVNSLEQIYAGLWTPGCSENFNWHVRSASVEPKGLHAVKKTGTLLPVYTELPGTPKNKSVLELICCMFNDQCIYIFWDKYL